jgi:hypothetical protein
MVFRGRAKRSETKSHPRRSKIIKSIRNTALWIGALLVVALGGGVAYTWYMGQQSVTLSTADETPTNEIAEPVSAAKHIVVDPNAKASASIGMLTSPVTPGMNASVDVTTNPNAECTISVIYDNVASKDSGLAPKTADDHGIVSWTWTVDSSVPYGTWPVKVTCMINKKSAVVEGKLVVAKQITQ